MKIVDCYLRALQKAEENMTNGGIKLDKARFVQLFNDEQNRLVRYILDKCIRKNLTRDEIKIIRKALYFHCLLISSLFQTYQAYLPKVNARSLILPCGRLRTKTRMNFLPTLLTNLILILGKHSIQ